MKKKKPVEIDPVKRNEHKRMFEFWGLKMPDNTPTDTIVKVHFDPSRIEKASPKKIAMIQLLAEEQATELKKGKKRSKQSLGEQSALRRLRRQNNFAALVSAGLITTVQQARSLTYDDKFDLERFKLPDPLRTVVNYGTIISYLESIGKRLLDEETGEMVGADEPVVKKDTGERINEVIDYYDGDPFKGGKKISEKAYRELIKNAIGGQHNV